MGVNTNSTIISKRNNSFLKSREFILLLIFVAIQIVNAQLSPYYLDGNGLLNATKNFLDKGFLALGMSLVLMIGEIDISVASIIALCSCVMGITVEAGVPMAVSIIISLGIGALCGFINGIIIAKFRELASMIVTLATMSLYRGIGWILLGDKGAGGYPDWFTYLSDGTMFSIGGIDIPFILIVFIATAMFFWFLLHKTVYGKRLFMIGNNPGTAFFSGIKVKNIRISVFVVSGVMSAITSIFLTSRILTSKPSIAMGFELEAIAIVVLGGIKTDGGTGNVLGTIISVFIVGFIRYGLGIKSIPSTVIMIIVGMLLILSILIPNIAGMVKVIVDQKKTKEKVSSNTSD